MELDADVDARALLLAQRLEPLRDLVDHLLAFVVLERRARRAAQLDLHRVHAVGGVDAAVDPHAIARRAAHQLVDRYAVGLARDVPQRLIDAARDRGLDRAAAVERAAVNRLPVEDDPERILADEIVADLQRPGGARLGVVLEHLAPAGDAGVGRDLHEDPRVREDERLDLGDLDVVLRSNLRGVRALRAPGGVKAERCRSSEQSTKPGAAIDLRAGHAVSPRKRQRVYSDTVVKYSRQYTREVQFNF